jgi:tripartite-type tricarboxylate transporter receptor subunit TctC
MQLSRWTLALLVATGVSQLAVAAGQGATPAAAGAYPTKAIRFVTSEVGGSGDIVSRLLAHALTASMGQALLVDNRPSVIIAGEIVAKAPPDGYTLITYGGTLWLGPYLRPSPYDPVKDFAPVTLVGSSPCVVVVPPSLGIQSVKELIALAKAKPGALNYGSGNSGSITHLAAELFNSMAGTKIVRIPYKGAGPALNDLVAGQVQVMIATGSSSTAFIKSGRLRALAVTGAEPSSLFPGLPTVSASGVPGYEAVAFSGIFTTAGTPAAIVGRLNREMVNVLRQADVREKLLNLGIETIASTPEKLAATVKSEMVRMGKVIKDAGIRE